MAGQPTCRTTKYSAAWLDLNRARAAGEGKARALVVARKGRHLSALTLPPRQRKQSQRIGARPADRMERSVRDVREALMVARNTDGKLVRRPLSPHLQIYRWPISMGLSISHRVTGSGSASARCC